MVRALFAWPTGRRWRILGAVFIQRMGAGIVPAHAKRAEEASRQPVNRHQRLFLGAEAIRPPFSRPLPGPAREGEGGHKGRTASARKTRWPLSGTRWENRMRRRGRRWNWKDAECLPHSSAGLPLPSDCYCAARFSPSSPRLRGLTIGWHSLVSQKRTGSPLPSTLLSMFIARLGFSSPVSPLRVPHPVARHRGRSHATQQPAVDDVRAAVV
mmetsp:Transcript_88712/g.148043  ORF Transcript_88712/g.148043 Transcript_88712/m.148043 type:complete len:212 (-) Transcript_88712:417-1052(-)